MYFFPTIQCSTLTPMKEFTLLVAVKQSPGVIVRGQYHNKNVSQYGQVQTTTNSKVNQEISLPTFNFRVYAWLFLPRGTLTR